MARAAAAITAYWFSDIIAQFELAFDEAANRSACSPTISYMTSRPGPFLERLFEITSRHGCRWRSGGEFTASDADTGA